MSTFAGFPKDGLALLAELPTQDKAWFAEQRKTYEKSLAEPAKRFVESLGSALQARISESMIALARTNQSIAPINNDVRFAKNKPPYKDHLLFRFWEGANKKTAPTLFVRLSASEVGFASGINPTDLDRWRERIAHKDHGAALSEALRTLACDRHIDIAGEQLKRVPAPYPADHAYGDLLRHKSFQVRWPEPLPKCVNDASFVDWCIDRLEALANIHHWFVRHL